MDATSESATMLELKNNIEHLQLHMLALFESRSKRTETRPVRDLFLFAFAARTGSGGVEQWVSQ